MQNRRTVKTPNGITTVGNKYGLVAENDDLSNVNIFEVIDTLGLYEDMHEKVEKRIAETKSSSGYPYNFKGQTVEDLEWVLSLLN